MQAISMTVEEAVQRLFDDLCALQFGFYQVAEALDKNHIISCQELGDMIEIVGKASTGGSEVPPSFAHLASMVRNDSMPAFPEIHLASGQRGTA